MVNMTKVDSRTIINAKNLSAGFGQSIIWQSASFKIFKGEFVGVLGPNGAGKTTLFRLLLGLNRPLGGSLELFGDPPVAATRESVIFRSADRLMTRCGLKRPNSCGWEFMDHVGDFVCRRPLAANAVKPSPP